MREFIDRIRRAVARAIEPAPTTIMVSIEVGDDPADARRAAYKIRLEDISSPTLSSLGRRQLLERAGRS
jgi:hypothetical protein